MSETNEAKKLSIKYVKSAIGYSQRHKDTIRTLGLRRLNQTVLMDDNAVVRGMLAKVAHLVRFEEVAE